MPRSLHRRVAPYLPGPGPLILYLFACALLIIGLIAAIAYGYGVYDGGDRFGSFAFIFGFIILPVAALMTEIAALFERAIPAKAGLGFSATLFLLLATFIAIAAFSLDPKMGFPLLEGVGTGLMCCGPFLIVSLILPIYAIVRLPEALREIGRTQRAARVIDAVQARGGQIAYAELADTLRESTESVDALLRDRLASGELVGVRRPHYGCFFTEAALDERRRHLLGMIHARGSVSLDGMADELRVPKALAQEWLYELVQAGQFTGYLNWEREQVLLPTGPEPARRRSVPQL